MKPIETLGQGFIKKHKYLLEEARLNEVAICGGCAAAVSKGRADYIPADLDLVTTKSNALRFLDQINHFLIEHSVHYRIYVNSKNPFVPEPALSHFRIQTPFWVPVCLFVIPHNEFRYYRIQGGHLLQLPRDIKQAANALTEKDEKPRIANDLYEYEDVFEDLEPDPIKEDFFNSEQFREGPTDLPVMPQYPKLP